MIAAFIQGISETMPISSSMHLSLLGYSQNTAIYLHIYTAIASLLFYRHHLSRSTLSLLLLLTLTQALAYFIAQILHLPHLLSLIYINNTPPIMSIVSGTLLIKFSSSPSSTTLSPSSTTPSPTPSSTTSSPSSTTPSTTPSSTTPSHSPTSSLTTPPHLSSTTFPLISIKSLSIIIFWQTLGCISGFSRLASALLMLKHLHIKNPWSLAVLSGALPLLLAALTLDTTSSILYSTYILSLGIICSTICYFSYLFSPKIPLLYYGIYKILLGLLLLII